MPSKKRNNKKAKMEKRRTRHNQNRKEGVNMTGNIGETTDSVLNGTTGVAAEVTEMPDTIVSETVKDIADNTEVNGTAETVKVEEIKAEEIKTEAALETGCPENMEDNEVENNKPENVTVTKEASHKLYIQYNDLEFSDELMFEAAVNAYCNEYGKDKSSVEAVNLYVKPQEGKAYYVINNDAEKTGSIDL